MMFFSGDAVGVKIFKLSELDGKYFLFAFLLDIVLCGIQRTDLMN